MILKSEKFCLHAYSKCMHRDSVQCWEFGWRDCGCPLMDETCSGAASHVTSWVVVWTVVTWPVHLVVVRYTRWLKRKQHKIMTRTIKDDSWSKNGVCETRARAFMLLFAFYPGSVRSTRETQPHSLVPTSSLTHLFLPCCCSLRALCVYLKFHQYWGACLCSSSDRYPVTTATWASRECSMALATSYSLSVSQE